MVDEPFIEECYADQNGQVAWTGLKMNDGNDFVELLATEVASRVHDIDASAEFEVHLRGLASTGFEKDSLEQLLQSAHQEDRDWAFGEALAEVHLSREYAITWPWNTERDKRTPRASLPGADLVGLMTDDEGALLALGEVKCSSEAKSPPQTMSGRSGGMAHQLDKLADDLQLLSTLVRWLFLRCKATEFEASFNLAMTRLLQSGNREVALFGVLIRDTEPNQKDLCTRGRNLGGRLQAPTSCRLTALHLPCPIKHLPARVDGGKL